MSKFTWKQGRKGCNFEKPIFIFHLVVIIQYIILILKTKILPYRVGWYMVMKSLGFFPSTCVLWQKNAQVYVKSLLGKKNHFNEKAVNRNYDSFFYEMSIIRRNNIKIPKYLHDSNIQEIILYGKHF